MAARPSRRWRTATPSYPLADVRLLAPLVPPIILNSGQNYWDHRDEKPPVEQHDPEFFLKAPLGVIGPDDPVILDPVVTRKLDYEVELGVVIGKPGRHIPREQALDHVFGYTVANDVTARDRQAVPHPEGGFEYRLGPGKNFDTCAPIGPWIVTRDEIDDPQSLGLRTYVNGELRQSNTTAKMIWDVATLVSVLLRLLHAPAGCPDRDGNPRRNGVGHRSGDRRQALRSRTTSSAPAICSRATSSPSRSTASVRSRIRSSHRTRPQCLPRRRQPPDRRLSMAQALLEEAPTLFINAKLIDGNGGEPVEDGAVRVEGNRITQVGRTADWGENPNGNNRVIDLKGKTLMPGLTEGHFHISFWGVRELPDLDLKLPAELSTIYAVKNAELALRCGYTSAASAGALHRVDVTVRDAIEEGIIFGPRLAASGRDICATSGMLDWNPSFWRLGMEGLAIFADGVDEVRKAVRQNIREGCDVIKLYVTGEGLLRGKPGIPPEETMYSLEEIQAAVREAHTRNRQIAAHVRGDDGVKLCVEAGHRRDRARDLRRRRGDRDDRRAPGRHLRRPRARLPLGHPREGTRLRYLAGDDRRVRVPGRVGARLPGDEEAARGRRPRHPRRRLRLHLVPARRVREGHRALRHRHGLLADGGDRRGDEARLAS